MTELATQVRLRAGERCEYCLIPQSAFRRALHLEHIIARQHGGESVTENLALACWRCNLKKGPNLSGIDPESGRITPLFHPRLHSWADHFSLSAQPDGIFIEGLTPTGRASAQVLGMNEELRPMLRYELWLEGKYSGDKHSPA